MTSSNPFFWTSWVYVIDFLLLEPRSSLLLDQTIKTHTFEVLNQGFSVGFDKNIAIQTKYSSQRQSCNVERVKEMCYQLGPEKGVIHLATAAVLNAVWDLWARAESKVGTILIMSVNFSNKHSSWLTPCCHRLPAAAVEAARRHGES